VTRKPKSKKPVMQTLLGENADFVKLAGSLLGRGGSKKAMAKVGRQRAAEEPDEIPFDPRFHPGAIRRATLFGHSHEQCAALLGISPPTLARWLTYPSVQVEVSKARLKWLELGEFAVDKAIGEQEGGDTRLLTLFLKGKLGIREDGPQELDAPAASQTRVSQEDAAGLIERLEQSARALSSDDGSGPETS